MTRNFAIYVSEENGARKNPRHSSWKLILAGKLKAQRQSFQEFTFAPVRAKYLRLQLIDNHGGSMIGVGELKLMLE